MSELHGIIFDLDGTLTDTLPLVCHAFRQAFARVLDQSYSDEAIHALFGPSEEGIVQRVAGERWQACLDAYLECYEREHDALARLFPGVEELLGWLQRRGIRLAIVTGKGPRSTAISLRKLALTRSIDEVRTGAPEGPVKPAAIREILQRWGLAPRQVAYVGDAPLDMQAAREVGVLPLGAAWAAGADAAALRAAGAAEVFSSPRALHTWLLAHRAPLAPDAER